MGKLFFTTPAKPFMGKIHDLHGNYNVPFVIHREFLIPPFAASRLMVELSRYKFQKWLDQYIPKRSACCTNILLHSHFRRPMLALWVMKLFGTDIFLYVNLYRAKVFGTDIFLYVNLYRAHAFGTDICLGQTSVWKKKLSSKTFLFLHLFGCKQFY